ncbi:GDSL-type esterase/lipase family protein [Amycolatopsis sp.]|uniref:GDSL-type esterase/lipase family protein n=1 Tax=Amycolatopsis sp. TaxID=37632 RepID=UPI002CB792E4|nr:GDSL-type esterase/lipase family protein [Amycolatopsis sp.]HVV13621.1 GDSL-type esterase/lipase family protein [Amycolatopsis sp.]
MHTTPITLELVRGARELEPTGQGFLPHRLPAWARAQTNDPRLTMSQSQPSGVRLVLRTAATVVELDTLRTKVSYRNAPAPPDGVYDLLIDGELTAQANVPDGNVLLVDMMTGAMERQPGPAGTVRFSGLPAREKLVEIWLPHNEITELAALRTDAPAETVPMERRVWLHHGSSISNGTGAASPTQTWPALAAAAGDVELIQLGLGGGALLDPCTARTMRDTTADLISVKIGINLVNADLMRPRAFTPAVHGFLDTIREGHPDAPLLVISPIYCPIHEDTPGPGIPSFEDGAVRFHATGEPAPGKLTLTVIRDELARIVKQRAAEDPALSYLDGLELYGPADFEELPLPDALHPDAATHHRIAERFTARAFRDGAVFG